MTVVYLDSVFLLNALTDYFLLMATACLADVPFRRSRGIAAALLGGSYAAAVFLPEGRFLAAFPGKLAAGALMAWAAYGGSRRLPKLILLLFLVSCGFAGCVLCIGLTAGGVPMANGIFYTNVNVGVLLMAAGGAYVVMSLVFWASAGHAIQGIRLPVKLELNGRSVRLTALCDTGNSLRDPMTGRPLLIVWSPLLRPLWPKPLSGLLTESALEHPAELLGRLGEETARFRLIPYRAVGITSGLLLAVRIDRGIIGGKCCDDLLVALSPTELGDGFGALWGEVERSEKLEYFTETGAEAFDDAESDPKTAASLHRWKRHAPCTAAAGGRGGFAAASGRGNGKTDTH